VIAVAEGSQVEQKKTLKMLVSIIKVQNQLANYG
jgi:hypothetical protein